MPYFEKEFYETEPHEKELLEAKRERQRRRQIVRSRRESFFNMRLNFGCQMFLGIPIINLRDF